MDSIASIKNSVLSMVNALLEIERMNVNYSTSCARVSEYVQPIIVFISLSGEFRGRVWEQIIKLPPEVVDPWIASVDILIFICEELILTEINDCGQEQRTTLIQKLRVHLMDLRTNVLNN